MLWLLGLPSWARTLGAIGITAMVCFPAGVVKGWNWSNAQNWQRYASELESAVKASQAMAEADRAQAEKDAKEHAQVEATLESVLHEQRKAPQCPLSDDDRRLLQRLASLSQY